MNKPMILVIQCKGMRLRLLLRPLQARPSVPVNYQYPVSAAVYKILAKASPEYSKWLHDKGYRSSAGRLIKLFTFSRLHIPRVRLKDGVLTAGDGQPWQLLVDSPMEEEFVQNFVMGLFQDYRLEIGGRGAVGRFMIESVEALPIPELEHQMKGKTLSPIVASTIIDANGNRKKYFYRPTNEGIGQALQKNISEKYEIIHGARPDRGDFEIRLDMDYYERRRGKVTKKIKIKEGTAEETEIISFEMPFTVRGNPELIRCAWECGLGEHTSQRFGMVELFQ